MWHNGKRRTVPSSFYGLVDVLIMKEHHWTLAQWESQPQSLADELRIDMTMARKIAATKTRQAEARARSAKRGGRRR